MMSNLKVLTATLAALLAMGAFASIAQAGSLDVQLDAEGDATLIATNTNNHVFTVEGGSVTCNNVRLEGTVSGANNATANFTAATLTPIYNGCTAFGFVSVTITMNGCKFIKTWSPSPILRANTHIVGCTPGKTITIHIALTGCTISVPEQAGAGGAGLSHVAFTNNGLPGKEMATTAAATVSGITYTENAGCPSPGHFANGTYTGSSTLRAFVDNGSELKSIHAHEFHTLIAGGQLEVTAT